MSHTAKVSAVGLIGLEGSLVTVEGAAGRQLPGMNIVGLPDTALIEARQRVRQAALASGFSLTERFVLINLQPADLPKHGSSFDLAIAIAALVVLKKMPGYDLAQTIHIGELGLDGHVRRPRGLLASVNAAKKLGFKTVMVPSDGFHEAKLVPNIKIVAVKSLRGAINWYTGKKGDWFTEQELDDSSKQQPLQIGAQEVSKSTLTNIDDITGQDEAIEVLKIAAAGRHHVHMNGPPGAGKTMLAGALPSILPDLTTPEALIVSSLKTLNHGEPMNSLNLRPPFEHPHHSASVPAIVGTAQGGWLRPGAISYSSYGVLFLDEVQEFPARVLDMLRQPLESGFIQIHRAFLKAVLPAKVQLILASNPCPCGFGGSVKTVSKCSCSPNQIRRYNSKISGPLLDRIDIRYNVDRVTKIVNDGTETRHKKDLIKNEVLQARRAAKERFRLEKWNLNAEIPGPILRSKKYHPGKKATAVLDRALEIGNLTLRGYDKVLRLAWSICDLRGGTSPGRDEIATAISLREGESI